LGVNTLLNAPVEHPSSNLNTRWVHWGNTLRTP